MDADVLIEGRRCISDAALPQQFDDDENDENNGISFRSMSEVSGMTPGFVMKQSKWLKEWRSRYFFATGSSLYFAQRAGCEHHDHINLANAVCYASIQQTKDKMPCWYKLDIASKYRHCKLRTQEREVFERLKAFMRQHGCRIENNGVNSRKFTFSKNTSSVQNSAEATTGILPSPNEPKRRMDARAPHLKEAEPSAQVVKPPRRMAALLKAFKNNPLYFWFSMAVLTVLLASELSMPLIFPIMGMFSLCIFEVWIKERLPVTTADAHQRRR